MVNKRLWISPLFGVLSVFKLIGVEKDSVGDNEFIEVKFTLSQWHVMIDALRQLASQFFAQRVKVARRRQLQERSSNPGRRRDKRLESGPIDQQ